MHSSGLASWDVYNCSHCRCRAAWPVEVHWVCFGCGWAALLIVLLSCRLPRRARGEKAGARADFQEKETPAVTIDSALIYDSLTSWREAPFFFPNVLSLFFLFGEWKLLLINATEAAGRCWKLTGRQRQEGGKKRKALRWLRKQRTGDKGNSGSKLNGYNVP